MPVEHHGIFAVPDLRRASQVRLPPHDELSRSFNHAAVVGPRTEENVASLTVHREPGQVNFAVALQFSRRRIENISVISHHRPRVKYRRFEIDSAKIT